MRKWGSSGTSVLSHSSYEWGNHGASMIRRGGSQAQLDALIAGDPESDVFDDTQKLVLKFTTEVTIDAKPSEATLTAMGEQFTHKQIAQLVCAGKIPPPSSAEFPDTALSVSVRVPEWL